MKHEEINYKRQLKQEYLRGLTKSQTNMKEHFNVFLEILKDRLSAVQLDTSDAGTDEDLESVINLIDDYVCDKISLNEVISRVNKSSDLYRERVNHLDGELLLLTDFLDED